MKAPKKHIKVSKLFRSKVFRILWSVFLVLGLLQVILFFGSDLLLRNFLKEKVRQSSEGKYEIDFQNFHILFIQRGISFKGLKINPLDERIEELDNIAYYDVDVPEMSITGINYLFRKKELVFGNISLTKPSVDFRLKIDDTEEMEFEESPLEILQEEIRKSFLGSKLNEIRIKKLQVDNADLLIKNFIAQRSIKAENSALYLQNVQLLQSRIPETPFNAEGFSFEIDNFEILLADSVHTIEAQKISVSSLDQYIQAKNAKITPDFDRYSETYFEVSLEDLLLSDADINKVFYTTEVEVGKLALHKPVFSLYVGERKKKQEDVKPFDFYDLIEGILVSIQIKDLEIEQGVFAQRNILRPDSYMIKTERIDFNMSDFYVGPNESEKKNRFFYADHATVDLYDVDLILGDSIHQVKGDFVRLSSYEDQIRIEGFKLFPVEEQDTIKGITLLDIDVPQLSITNANLKKIYNEGIVDVQGILVENPEIILKDIQAKSTEKEFDLSAFYSEYLEGIYVKRFEIKEGSLVVDNKIRVRQDSLSFGKVNMVLENFALDEKTEISEAKSFFWADHLQLELQDYALKLADNLHVFKADRVFLDTKLSRIQIDGFALKPADPNQIQSTLDRYGKSTTLDIFVPHFSAEGVDIKSAYFDEVLNVNRILVPSPKIGIFRYRPVVEDLEEEKVDQQEILQLLTNYFKEVKVKSLVLQRGTLNYENYIRERIRTFSEDNVSIAVKNFHINEQTNPDELKFLFSEEVDLRLNNYVFNIADGKYNILADRINFNTAREEIIASNVRLIPRNVFTDKTRVRATIPEMSFRGVDLESFLFENTLSLEKVKLSGSNVNVLINNDLDDQDAPVARRQRRERNLPKIIDIVKIDTIEAEKALFSLGFREGGVQTELINTGVDLSFYDFMLDSAIISRGNIVEFFTSMALGIDEFWLTLKDSVHQVTFSKVELDTRYEGILLDNFRIIPRDLSGKPGNPVFSGHIPTILIKIRSLAEIQSNKDLWIKELRLFRPDMEVFVDQVKRDPKDGGEKEIKEGLFSSLQIDDFEIVEGNLAFFQKDGSKEPQILKKLSLAFEDLKLDLNELQDFKTKDLLQKEFKLTFPDFSLLLKDSLNKVSIGMVSITNQEIALSDVSIEPRYGWYQYGKKVGVQTDVINVHLPSVLILNPDLDLLTEYEMLKAPKILVRDAKGEFFRDKRYKREQGIFRPMPQALMRKAGLNVQVDTFLVENASIFYHEFPENGMVPGQLSFTELSASLIPFQLSKVALDGLHNEASLFATAKINGQAPISLQGRLSFQPPYPMKISAQLDAFDLDHLNSILVPNAFVKVRSGRVNGADWSFTADNEKAIGSMKFLYNDLKMDLLDERTLEIASGRKKILTFVLNVFAVRTHNPRGFFNTTIASNIYFPRDKERFIFNYWWKASFSGLKGSVGLGQPKVPKRKKEEEED